MVSFSFPSFPPNIRGNAYSLQVHVKPFVNLANQSHAIFSYGKNETIYKTKIQRMHFKYLILQNLCLHNTYVVL